MSLQRENIHVNSATTDGVDHTMLVGNATTPFALKISLQWFRFAKSCKRVFLDILQQRGNALHDFIVTCLLPVVAVFLGLFEQYYFHRSSIATGSKLPLAISCSPWRTMSSNSAIDISAFFCEAIRLSDLTAFRIRPSSSDMVWRAPKSSALSCICTAVITQ